MIELEVPYKQGYGEEGHPPTIPPKATLHFLIELLEVK
jgi:FKBP-type peptidyl-prolyl cis-trans isomerase